MKVLHIINSLKKGGAEGNLYRLCLEQKKKFHNKINITVITLINNGYYESKLQKKNIKIISLGINKKTKIFQLIKKISKLRNYIKKNKQDIIQSWMYHSNFLTLFLPRENQNKIFWNIRHSELNPKISKKNTILISIICGLFSRFVPKKIFYCSEKSINFHEKKQFYCKNKSSLIDNGYSGKIYYPSNKLRLSFRKKNNIKSKDIIFGFAGRYAKQKNIGALLQSFYSLTQKYKNLKLYMAGKNINLENIDLNNSISKHKIDNKVFLLNEQKNLLGFYNGIDVLILVSHSESFPNVVAEAMLCSTPVLSSNAGCASKIIDKYGFVLNKNDFSSISKGIDKTVNTFMKNKIFWKSLKKNARTQIKKNFSIEKMADSYIRNWIF